MTPIYLKISICLILAALIALVSLLYLRPTLRLHLTYPLANAPRLPLSVADWPFCLRLIKFLSKRVQLKKLDYQIKLAGQPDFSALYGGALLAGLHGLAAAANCRDTQVKLHLTPNEPKTVGEISLRLTLPLWVLIAAALRLAVYFIKRRSILKASKIS